MKVVTSSYGVWLASSAFQFIFLLNIQILLLAYCTVNVIAHSSRHMQDKDERQFILNSTEPCRKKKKREKLSHVSVSADFPLIKSTSLLLYKSI